MSKFDNLTEKKITVTSTAFFELKHNEIQRG